MYTKTQEEGYVTALAAEEGMFPGCVIASVSICLATYLSLVDLYIHSPSRLKTWYNHRHVSRMQWGSYAGMESFDG